MNNLLSILSEAQKASQFALDLKGRSLGLKFCTVTDNRDPLGLRRLKVTMESTGGLVSTDWLLRLPIIPYYDPPLPAIGTSVIVAFIDNDPHDGVWLGVTCNLTNPSDTEQSDPIADSTQTIPGNNKLTIEGRDTQTVVSDRIATIKGDYTHTTNSAENRRIDEDLVVSVGQSLTLKTDSGCSLTLSPSGFIVLKDAYGNQMIVGGARGGHGSPSDLEWKIAGDINLNTTGKVKINGKDIAVVGGGVSKGVIVESGQ